MSPHERITSAIRAAAAGGEPALVAYLTAGFPQRAQFALRQGQEHLPGGRVREAGREHRETAPVAADDPELLTGQPGQPLPRYTASLQQINEPVPAHACGHQFADTADELGTGLTRPACHASTLLQGQPGDGDDVGPAPSRCRAHVWLLSLGRPGLPRLRRRGRG